MSAFISAKGEFKSIVSYEIFLSFLNFSRKAASGAKWRTFIFLLKKSVSLFKYNHKSLCRSSEKVDGDSAFTLILL